MKSFATAVAAFLVVTSFAQGNPKKAVESQIARYDHALEAKNIAGMKAILAPDFQAFDNQGHPLPVKAVFAQMSALFKVAKTIHVTTTVVNFKPNKTGAVATEKSVVDAVLTVNGKLSKLHVDSLSDTTWGLSKGSYVIKSTKQIRDTVMMDGKKVG